MCTLKTVYFEDLVCERDCLASPKRQSITTRVEGEPDGLFDHRKEQGRVISLIQPSSAIIPNRPWASTFIAHGSERSVPVPISRFEKVGKRLRLCRTGLRCEGLLRHPVPLMGERQQRELQRTAPPIPPQKNQPSPHHAGGLRPDSQKAEHETSQEARLSHTGGMLLWNLGDRALRT